MSDFLPGLDEALHRNRTIQRGSHAPLDCALCIILRHAKEEHREAYSSAAAGTISARALHRALRVMGIRIDRESINNHRNEAHSV